MDDPMKHNATTFYTRKILAESLKKLIRRKSFSNITVREITEDCGLNRNTFYYHFEDINDLLKWTLEQEAIDVVKYFDLMSDYEEAVRFVMNYIEENEKLLNNICNSLGQGELKRFFFNDLYGITSSVIDKTIQQMEMSIPSDYRDFLSRFYTEAFAGLLMDGITNPTLRNNDKNILYISLVIRSSLPPLLSDYAAQQKAEKEE